VKRATEGSGCRWLIGLFAQSARPLHGKSLCLNLLPALRATSQRACSQACLMAHHNVFHSSRVDPVRALPDSCQTLRQRLDALIWCQTDQHLARAYERPR